MTTPAISSSPDLGVSRRALSIARAIDRLPPGVYLVRVEKPALAALDWPVDIDRVESVQRLLAERKAEK